MAKKKGIIICGYPCIGKSSITEKSQIYIDLESSGFSKDNPLWYKDYCNTAVNLAKQGRIVFVSTHSEVINFFEKIRNDYLYDDIYICIFCPQPTWWDFWIVKAKLRFDDMPSHKNSVALERIRNYFNNDIKQILTSTLPIIMPATLSYNLLDYTKVIYNEVCQ